MGEAMIVWKVVALFLLLLMPLVLGWGNEGHYATCKIAEEYLSEDALFAVKKLLPDYAQGDLASLCSWPDEVRRDPNYRWSGELHFSDTPDFKCDYQYCRDCHDSYGHKDRCVTAAIYNYTMQLKSAYAGSDSEVKYNLTEALIFLSHFVGDVHQPLHVGFIGDLGGNRIKVHWYDRETNLHRVWDDMIIESALKTFYNSDLSVMIQSIQANIRDNWLNDVSVWEECAHNYTACPEGYAGESVSLACEYAYPNATAGSTLGDEYFLSRVGIVEKRVAQGGVRLAATLNRIFLPHTTIARASI